LFTAPAHPNWGGTALIGRAGELLGIGSLQLERPREGGASEHLNMIVPINLLKPILEELLTYGRRNRPARPWLGLYATEIEDRVIIVGLATGGPAQRANVRTGDVVLAAAGTEVKGLADLFRRVWALGEAGVEVPLLLYRDGRTLEVRIASSDRNRFLKGPSVH
jgi:S1-C subfamily serine protease